MTVIPALIDKTGRVHSAGLLFEEPPVVRMGGSGWFLAIPVLLLLFKEELLGS